MTVFDLLKEINNGNFDKLPQKIEVDGDIWKKRKENEEYINAEDEKEELINTLSRMYFARDYLKLQVNELKEREEKGMKVKTKLGDVITTKNNKRYVVVRKIGAIDLDNENSTIFGGLEKKDIIKIERIRNGKVEVVYKRKVLTDKEKEYLSNVIRPFKNRVLYISKHQSCNGEYISIGLNGEQSTELPYFEINTMYKNMKNEEIYTLEELGL